MRIFVGGSVHDLIPCTITWNLLPRLQYTASHPAIYPPLYLEFSLPKSINTSDLITLNQILLPAYLLILCSVFKEPAIVERRHSRPAGSTNINCVDTLTCREPSAFKRNIGYTRHRRGRGRGSARGGSSQALSRGGAPNLAHAVPYRPLRNPINQLRSRWVVS